MTYGGDRCGDIRFNLVACSGERCLCLANDAVFYLKEAVMMVQGQGNHAQQKARGQEQT
jgi:hypothetical protein